MWMINYMDDWGPGTQVKGKTCAKVWNQEHPWVFAEQQRGACSWKGFTKEVCGTGRGHGSMWTWWAGNHFSTPSQGAAWPDLRFHKVTVCIMKNVAKSVNTSGYCIWSLKRSLEVITAIALFHRWVFCKYQLKRKTRGLLWWSSV